MKRKVFLFLVIGFLLWLATAPAFGQEEEYFFYAGDGKIVHLVMDKTEVHHGEPLVLSYGDKQKVVAERFFGVAKLVHYRVENSNEGVVVVTEKISIVSEKDTNGVRPPEMSRSIALDKEGNFTDVWALGQPNKPFKKNAYQKARQRLYLNGKLFLVVDLTLTPKEIHAAFWPVYRRTNEGVWISMAEHLGLH